MLMFFLMHFLRYEQLPENCLEKFTDLFNFSRTPLLDNMTNDESQTENGIRNNGKRVIFHRGGSIHAPENTLEAIREV